MSDKKSTLRKTIQIKDYFEIKDDIVTTVSDKIDALRIEMNTKFESIEKRLTMMTIFISIFLTLITVLMSIYEFIK